MKRDIIVQAYLFHKSEVLLVKDRDTGLWVPPGGKVREDERLLRALIRNLQKKVNYHPEMKYGEFGSYPIGDRSELPKTVSIHENYLEEKTELIIEFVGKVNSKSKLRNNRHYYTDAGFFRVKEIDQDTFIPVVIREKVQEAWKFV